MALSDDAMGASAAMRLEVVRGGDMSMGLTVNLLNPITRTITHKTIKTKETRHSRV